MIQRNTIIEDSETQQFFEEINILISPYLENPLFQRLVKALRKHCNPLLPMASRQYRTQGNNMSVPLVITPNRKHGNLIFEIGHDGGHIIGHGIHFLLHELHTSELIQISHSLLNFVPLCAVILCGIVKALEVWNEHRVLDNISDQLAKLHDYSPTQQDAVYKYVIAKSMSSLNEQIQANPDEKFWHFSLLTQSLISLSIIGGKFESIRELGVAWSQDIVYRFKIYAVDSSPVTYMTSSLAIAVQVQDILSKDYQRTEDAVYLKLPEVGIKKNLCGKIERGLYDILNSYSERVRTWYELSYVIGYTTKQLDSIILYFVRFNHALQVISEERARNNLMIGDEQSHLIEICLKGSLDEMALAIKDAPGNNCVINLSLLTNMMGILSVSKPMCLLRNEDKVIILNTLVAIQVLSITMQKLKKDIELLMFTQKAHQLISRLEENNIGYKPSNAVREVIVRDSEERICSSINADIASMIEEVKNSFEHHNPDKFPVLLKIRSILSKPYNPLEDDVYLHLPEPGLERNLRSLIEINLYKILMSYKNRVTGREIVGLALGYSAKQLCTIKESFIRFNRILQLMNAERAELNPDTNIGNYQLTEIEMLLKSYLDKVAFELKDNPWSSIISELSISTGTRGILCPSNKEGIDGSDREIIRPFIQVKVLLSIISKIKSELYLRSGRSKPGLFPEEIENAIATHGYFVAVP